MIGNLGLILPDPMASTDQITRRGFSWIMVQTMIQGYRNHRPAISHPPNFKPDHDDHDVRHKICKKIYMLFK